MGEKICKKNASELGKLGAAKSAEVRQRKRDMRERIKAWGDIPLKKGKVYSPAEVKFLAETKGLNMTLDDAIMLTFYREVLSGNMTALLKWMELHGINNVSEVKMEVTESEALTNMKKRLAENPNALDDLINDAESK